MLSIPEMTMNPRKKLITKCMGEKKIWDSREEAKDFFLEAMMNSEGMEHERYSAVFLQIQNGLSYCRDTEEQQNEQED